MAGGWGCGKRVQECRDHPLLQRLPIGGGYGVTFAQLVAQVFDEHML